MSRSSSSPLLFLLLALLLLHTNACQHDKLNYTIPRPENNSPVEARILASSQKQKIRIVAYYLIDNAPADIKQSISEQIVPAAIAYYQAALNAIPSPKPLSFPDVILTNCVNNTKLSAPQALRDGVEADLALIVTGSSQPDSGFIAMANACYLEPNFNRPNLGHIDFNYAKVGGTGDQDYIDDLYVVMHEMGHVLGFSAGLYEYYINPTTGHTFEPLKDKIVNGETIKVLHVEPLTKRLQSYFGCPSLDGAYLENQGTSASASSHFERRVFMNDALTASAISDQRMTEFFLALLEGTGWYSVNYDMAEPLTWGKGKGCTFLDSKCVKSDQTSAFPDSFCMPLAQDGCNFGYRGYGFCGTPVLGPKSSILPSSYNYYGDNQVVLDPFADNCPYYIDYSEATCGDPSNSAIHLPGKEYFGSGSSCFTGTLNSGSVTQPFCFKKTCQKIASNTYQVIVNIGDQTITCKKAESVSVNGLSGKFNCPDPTAYCKATEVSYCPRGCMGRGKCEGNKCVCSNGYSGSDCSKRASSTIKEGTMEYIESFPGFTLSSSSANKSKSKIPLRLLSVVIGVGIIGMTVVVGLTVNKIRDVKLKREARKTSKVEYKLSHAAPDYTYHFPNSNGMSPNMSVIQLGVIEEMQPPANASAIRQGALRDYFAPPVDQANVDKLAVLRENSSSVSTRTSIHDSAANVHLNNTQDKDLQGK